MRTQCTRAYQASARTDLASKEETTRTRLEAGNRSDISGSWFEVDSFEGAKGGEPKGFMSSYGPRVRKRPWRRLSPKHGGHEALALSTETLGARPLGSSGALSV